MRVTAWHGWPGGDGTKAGFSQNRPLREPSQSKSIQANPSDPALKQEAPPTKETAGNPQGKLAAKKRKRRKNSGVADREIREIRESRVAFAGVLRVVRSEKAFLARLPRLFAANQWKCLSRNCLHTTWSSPGQAQSGLIKANQVIFPP
ncbi:MAG: hypothetical protein ABSC18_09355 [Verrucomicrobiota bacterium]